MRTSRALTLTAARRKSSHKPPARVVFFLPPHFITLMRESGPARELLKFFYKTIDKSFSVCYNIDTKERGVSNDDFDYCGLGVSLRDLSEKNFR